MAGTQMIKVSLQRDSLHTPWGFRLQGGADFCMPFMINKITAGSPADGVLHRGDVILEIDHRPISSMQHLDALELVQRAGGQITFLIQRGLGPHLSFNHPQRPVSAMPWSLINASTYIEKAVAQPWRPPASPLSAAGLYRNRALERIPDPKPILSQTGSPLMPGPVPSVSTKTRGYVQPPAFHTERSALANESPVHASYSPVQNSANHHHHHAAQYDSDVYIPSYQKKVITSTTNKRSNQPVHHQYTTITRQTQSYRPSSVQPTGLVHRQYNSPMGLYSNQNIQDAMKNHVSHISHVSIVPSTPKPAYGNYTVAVSSPSYNSYTTSNGHATYVEPRQNHFASDF